MICVTRVVGLGILINAFFKAGEIHLCQDSIFSIIKNNEIHQVNQFNYRVQHFLYMVMYSMFFKVAFSLAVFGMVVSFTLRLKSLSYEDGIKRVKFYSWCLFLTLLAVFLADFSWLNVFIAKQNKIYAYNKNSTIEYLMNPEKFMLD